MGPGPEKLHCGDWSAFHPPFWAFAHIHTHTHCIPYTADLHTPLLVSRAEMPERAQKLSHGEGEVMLLGFL